MNADSPTVEPRALAPELSVIVPTFNSADTIVACLDAVNKSAGVEFELIVVDDGSSDDTPELTQGRCDRWIAMDENRGPGGARNCGAASALGEILFFLDADVLVGPRTLADVLAILRREPGVSAAFCSYQEDTPEKNFFSQYKNLMHHYTHQVSEREATTFCGGFGAVRREVFEELGGFNPSLRAMEDVEFGYRMHITGHRTILEKDIHLTHLKHYSLMGLVRSDLMYRAIPWTRILWEKRLFRSDLNLQSNNVLSVGNVALMWLALGGIPFAPWWVAGAETMLFVALCAVNVPFLRFAARKRGALFAIQTSLMNVLFYSYSGFGLLIGTLAHWIGRPYGNEKRL